jgi:hypothetical protein
MSLYGEGSVLCYRIKHCSNHRTFCPLSWGYATGPRQSPPGLIPQPPSALGREREQPKYLHNNLPVLRHLLPSLCLYKSPQTRTNLMRSPRFGSRASDMSLLPKVRGTESLDAICSWLPLAICQPLDFLSTDSQIC